MNVSTKGVPQMNIKLTLNLSPNEASHLMYTLFRTVGSEPITGRLYNSIIDQVTGQTGIPYLFFHNGMWKVSQKQHAARPLDLQPSVHDITSEIVSVFEKKDLLDKLSKEIEEKQQQLAELRNTFFK